MSLCNLCLPAFSQKETCRREWEERVLVAAITFFLSNGESANAISTDRFILYAVLAAVVAVAYSFRARRYGKTE